jgi:hypothetical protein
MEREIQLRFPNLLREFESRGRRFELIKAYFSLIFSPTGLRLAKLYKARFELIALQTLGEK